jgi:hypothetical protein
MTVSPVTASRRNSVIPVALAAVLSMVGVVSVLGTSAANATTAKLGNKCLNSERGKTTNLLVCSKVGSKISWVKRKNPVTGGATATDPAVIGGPTAGVPRPLDVIALVNGTAPAAAAIKVDVTCTGLSGTPTQATQTASFSGQGGTQSLSFNLLDPGSANPTGSTCTATAAVTGATPTLRILVDGRPAAGPATTTVSAPAFGPKSQSAVTVLVDFGGSAAPAATTTTALVGATTTTIAGATTTTIAGTPTAPPASGRPEVSAKFIGVVPTGLTNVDVASTCTSPTAGAPFQTNNNRFGRVDATAVLPQTLAAATASAPATSCQLTATVLGTDLGSPSLRVLLNGIAIAGPTSGNLINSPAFAAPSAFGATIEITYPGAATTTTIPGATTTTIAGATTTTLAPAAGATTITLSRTGTAPASVTGYVVVLDCQNVRQGAAAPSAVQFTPIFGTTGGSSSYTIGYEPTSTCVVKVVTSVSTGSPAATTGTINVSVRGTALPATTNGSFTSGVISTTAPFAVVVTVSY